MMGRNQPQGFNQRAQGRIERGADRALPYDRPGLETGSRVRNRDRDEKSRSR